MSFLKLEQHIARWYTNRSFPHLTKHQGGYRVTHPEFSLLIHLHASLYENEMDMEMVRLDVPDTHAGQEFLACLLDFCTDNGYFPVAQAVDSANVAFWRALANFYPNPYSPEEYVHRSFDLRVHRLHH